MERAWEKYRKPKVFLKDLAGLASLLAFILVLTYRSDYEFNRPCGSPTNSSLGELTLRFPFNKESYKVDISECAYHAPTTAAAPTAAPLNGSTSPPPPPPTTAPATTAAPATTVSPTPTSNIARKRRSTDLNDDYKEIFARHAAVFDSEASLAFAIIAFLGVVWSFIAFIFYCVTDCKKSAFGGLDLFFTLLLGALLTIASALTTAVVSHLSNENFVKNTIAKCSSDAEETCALTSSGSFLQLYFAVAFGYIAAILFFINLLCLVACKETESYSTLGGASQQQQQQQENIPVQEKQNTYGGV